MKPLAVALMLLLAVPGCQSAKQRAEQKAKALVKQKARELAAQRLRKRAAEIRQGTQIEIRPAFKRPRCPLNGPCPYHSHYGLADIPPDQRHHNYAGGSCVFASIASTMEILGRSDAADYLTQRYSGGEGAGGLNAKLDALGWDYVTVTDGDERILDWCDRTGRGAGVTFKSNHFCSFLGWDNGYAVILDNNHTGEYEFYPRDEFLRSWRSHGGWATAIVATPLPRL